MIESWQRVLGILDRVQPHLRHIPDVTHSEIEELRSALRFERKTPHLGDSALTRDLWWCECGRGLGENTNLFDIHARWRFCPRCGASMDWKGVGLGAI